MVVEPVSSPLVDIPVESAVVENDLYTDHHEAPGAVSEPKLSKHETIALDKGWKPLDKFEGDPEDWRPAKEWLDRGELLDTIHSLTRKMKEQSESLDHLSEVNKKVAEVTRERTIAELEAKHRAAVEIGDIEAARASVQEIIKAQTAIPEINVAPKAPEVDPAVHAFVARHNSWFNDATAENVAMKAFAIKRDAELTAQNPGVPPADILMKLEGELKRTFPHRFAVTPSHGAMAPSSVPAKPKEITASMLPEFHQKMLKTLERTIKNFDKKSYIDNLKKTGQI